MQVEVTQVKTGFFGSGNTQDAVGVCLVIRTQPSSVVDDFHKLFDFRVEDAGIFGVCDHQTGCAFAHCSFERIQVGVTVVVRIKRYDLETGGPGAGCVGRVRENCGDDFIPLFGFCAGAVIGAHDRHVGIDRGGAGTGLQRKAIHPRYLFKELLEFVHQLEYSLHCILVLQWM